MKLTNYQLDVLTSKIWSEISKKRELILESEEFKSKLEEHLNQEEQEQCVTIILEIDEIAKELENKKLQLQKKKQEFRNLRNLRHGNPPSFNSYISQEEAKVFRENYNLPAMEDIKAEIILNTIEGRDDILSNLREKFSL